MNNTALLCLILEDRAHATLLPSRSFWREGWWDGILCWMSQNRRIKGGILLYFVDWCCFDIHEIHFNVLTNFHKAHDDMIFHNPSNCSVWQLNSSAIQNHFSGSEYLTASAAFLELSKFQEKPMRRQNASLSQFRSFSPEFFLVFFCSFFARWFIRRFGCDPCHL